jgi:hypothetical protein
MILGLDVEICKKILKNRGLKFLVKIRFQRGEKHFRRALDLLIDGWWKK